MKKIFIILLILTLVIPLSNVSANELSSRLKGRILLQVESKGEAWYVNPKDEKRYYMADGQEAYNIMRDFGVGITNNDLKKIQADKNFAKKHSGKIFLQVEKNGEAFYIDINGNDHYLKNGAEAYNIMRELGLGITNSDLEKIDNSYKDKIKANINLYNKEKINALKKAYSSEDKYCEEAEEKCKRECDSYVFDYDTGDFLYNTDANSMCEDACRYGYNECEDEEEKDDGCDGFEEECKRECDSYVFDYDTGDFLYNTDADSMCEDACRYGYNECN